MFRVFVDIDQCESKFMTSKSFLQLTLYYSVLIEVFLSNCMKVSHNSFLNIFSLCLGFVRVGASHYVNIM